MTREDLIETIVEAMQRSPSDPKRMSNRAWQWRMMKEWGVKWGKGFGKSRKYDRTTYKV